jgi:sirohydrochlorin ferrochelatase
MTAFVLFAHGSRIETANEAVRDVAAKMASSGGLSVEPAFLELGQPDLDGAIDRLAASGASRIIVLPYFLTLGTHLQRDLPKLVQDSARKHPGVEVEAAPPLDGHPALLDVLLARASEALARTPKPV